MTKNSCKIKTPIKKTIEQELTIESSVLHVITIYMTQLMALQFRTH